ncbi:hypothetical protein ACIQU5_27900 [Streptomyces sp. NPDC090306]|uniref:hypothetical protein n=1 Tax=Streptomyces sp. NPDC090306 TaxID=3365961 RepID=UPI003828A319
MTTPTMPRPVPRPPGLWRALARDAVLTPEETAARSAVPRPHTRPVPDAGTTPTRPGALRAVADRYVKAILGVGWRAEVMTLPGRVLVEGIGPGTAAVTVLVTYDETARYALQPHRTGPRWALVWPGEWRYYLTHRYIPLDAPQSRAPITCTCRKILHWPSRHLADEAVLALWAERERLHHEGQQVRRAYRCADDPLIWHGTSSDRAGYGPWPIPEVIRP